MSRIGKQPITIPQNTHVTVDGFTIVVKGPLGELKRVFRNDVNVAVQDGTVVVTPRSKSKDVIALWGTYASHVDNMIKGVNTPYQKKLIIEGVGYRAEMKGDTIVMQLGFSHPVTMNIPAGITVTVEKNTITVSGIDKELVGQFTAQIRDQKKPEPYKGKGIRYDNEVIRRKEGKRAS